MVQKNAKLWPQPTFGFKVFLRLDELSYGC